MKIKKARIILNEPGDTLEEIKEISDGFIPPIGLNHVMVSQWQVLSVELIGVKPTRYKPFYKFHWLIKNVQPNQNLKMLEGALRKSMDEL